METQELLEAIARYARREEVPPATGVAVAAGAEPREVGVPAGLQREIDRYFCIEQEGRK